MGDVSAERPSWRNIFMADVTPPEERSTGIGEKADGPVITVAREADRRADPENNRIQLSMRRLLRRTRWARTSSPTTLGRRSRR